MNTYKFLAFFMLLAMGAQAQTRMHTSNFSQYQHFYNPSLTGYEGTAVKSYYRNQWTGFEDAPKTIFLSGEVDVADLSPSERRKKHYQYRDSRGGFRGAKQAIGLVALQDRFGPARETELLLSYGTAIRLSEDLSLRWGTAMTYHNYRLDGSSLIVDQDSDPRYQNLQGQQSSIHKADLNLGLSLVAANYYMGYALQDITRGHFIKSGDDYIKDIYTRKHVVQAGYRANLTDQFGLIVNGLYQYDKRTEHTTEAQVKAVYQDMIWVGGGYRKDLAYHLTAGVNFSQLRISYAYESPVQEARSINRPTNEIGLAYTFRPSTEPRYGISSVSFW